MCGIFGYVGEALTIGSLVEGLLRLEYRGYDSCGIACILKGNLFIKKHAGKIKELQEELKNILKDKVSLGILHTRWATHGAPNEINAHPHLDCNKDIAVVHNGIIENYLLLKEKLIKENHKFNSQTDTEVIVHLIEKFYKNSLEEAVFKAVKNLKGSFALAIISKKEPYKLIGVRKNSPLIIGLNKSGNFLASDIPALLPLVSETVYLRDEEIVILEKEKIKLFNFEEEPLKIKVEKPNISSQEIEKKGYPHFMLKEIFEQPEVLKRLLSLYIHQGKIDFPDLNFSESFLKKIKFIYIVGCGTAYHAGYVGKYFLEKYSDVNVGIETSSELRYQKLNLDRNSLFIAISQSGETADTLAVVDLLKKQKAKILSICNVLGSSLVKESNGLIFTHAGPEIGVASTKAYTAQVLVLFLFSLYLAKLKGLLDKKTLNEMLDELKKIPLYQKKILEDIERIKIISQKFSKFGCFLFLGRGINYPSALEGALKLKEISYIPAEGYPAGEMKHGPIALIDEYRGVVCIAPKDELYEKMISNIQEIKARRGKILAIVNYGDKEVVNLSDESITIFKLKHQDFSPLLVAICLQLFAYFVAKNLGCEIDQPRNLAKSVTVE